MQQRKKLKTKKHKLQQDQPILFYFPQNSEHYKKREEEHEPEPELAAAAAASSSSWCWSQSSQQPRTQTHKRD
jgi:hypothetical protein